MKDQLITFETAKLAKEKGFNENVYDLFKTTFSEESATIEQPLDKPRSNKYYRNESKNNIIYLRPTQSLLQKWLREVHDIHIKLTCFTDNTWDGVLIYQDAPYEWDDNTAPVEAENCKTYEEALEICLQEALKLI